VAENTAMVAQIASIMGEQISVAKVAASIGTMGMVNLIGRALFVEAGKVLSWGTANPWAAVALSGVESATAGIQTYIVGCLAMEIGKNQGRILDLGDTQKVTVKAKKNYHSFIKAHR